MDALYDLKDLLVSELESYGKKGEMSASVLERVDMLAHAAKNLDKVIECMEEDEYSNDSDGSSRRRSSRSYSYDGRSYRDDGGSYRSRSSRNSRRSRQYSNHGELTDKLRDMMDDAPDDRTRQEIERLVMRMEQM